MARRGWLEYFAQVDAVVYVVDSNSPERFEESRFELDNLLKDFELSDVPILILANKCDIPTAATEDEIKKKMGLTQLTTGKECILNKEFRPIEVFVCSAVNRQGYIEGFKWLFQHLIR